MNAADLAHQAVWQHKAVQKEPELVELIERLNGIRLDTILEIGSQDGGTRWLWDQLLFPGGRVLSVDLNPTWVHSQGFWEDAHCIADSHDPETLVRVQEILKGQSLDLLFIDGDHSYEGVKEDYEMYSPLVKDGGLVVLHDIAPHATPEASEVDRFWAELDGDKWCSIWPHPADIWNAVLPADSCGIGVLRLVK